MTSLNQNSEAVNVVLKHVWTTCSTS